MIYFIQDTETRRIKIGVSAEPNQRLRQLQTAHAAELKLIAVMDGSRIEEQALHQLFTRKRGEWFEPTHDLLAFIREKTVSISPIVNKRQRVSEWKPELQGDSYIVSVARLAHHILSNGKGTLEEITPIMLENYPADHPPISLDIFQGEIQRLVDIQNE
jgi:hypothetical protein